VRRHYEALALILERTPEDRFVEARRTGDPEALGRDVYPLERAFEILSNYVAELNELGLERSGATAGDRAGNLRLMERDGVIGRERARRWRAILQMRNELQHEYPDVRSARVYGASVDLVRDLPGYLRAYVDWMRRLGFGENS
jgi:uncharacterized protein YutE (UPF0331/DUF86 family)